VKARLTGAALLRLEQPEKPAESPRQSRCLKGKANWEVSHTGGLLDPPHIFHDFSVFSLKLREEIKK
jgi:hypothetical protein